MKHRFGNDSVTYAPHGGYMYRLLGKDAEGRELWLQLRSDWVYVLDGDDLRPLGHISKVTPR